MLDTLQVGAVILAAGRSSRMGRPKLLLPWSDTTVLGHLLRQWTAAGASQVVTVLAAGDSALSEELDRLGVPASERILNPHPELGMFHSIQLAARWPGWRSGLTHWAISLGDQPHLRLSTLSAVFPNTAAEADLVSQPIGAEGLGRHPVLLPRKVFRMLTAVNAATLKAFLAQFPIRLCPVDDPGLELDLDYPEDYDRARQM
ncbi:MAG TPA: nucleotidyltransferase family protein [Clostridia bacterium]|nr:nucleotidyltransferase family protein [Clostridia bacterium]